MRSVAIIAALFLFITATASAQDSAGIKAVKDVNLRFQVLLYQLYELSDRNPPPGTNAASGKWRDKLVADPKIENLYKFSTAGLTGDASKLAEVFNVFYSGIYKAFSDNPNVEGKWAGKGTVFRTILGKAGERVYGISFNIYQSVGGNEAENEKFATEARNSARALIRKVDEKGPVYSGVHANSKIAVSSYKAANAALDKLDEQFAGDYSGPGGSSAKLLRQIFKEITTIPTISKAPWLLPSWQIQFQYLCLTGSIAMEKISPPEME